MAQKKIAYPNDPRLGPGVIRLEWGKVFRLFQFGPERITITSGARKGQKAAFHGYEMIGPRMYTLYRPIYQVGPKAYTFRERTKEITRSCHDGECPKCGFPETIFVHEITNVRQKGDGFTFKMGDPIEERCSSSKCDWSRKIRAKK